MYTLLYLKQITNKDLLFKKLKILRKRLKTKEYLGTTGNEELQKKNGVLYFEQEIDGYKIRHIWLKHS